ncbi:MAG: glycosyltransferase family 4 protein [Caldilineaceae bacterium]
MTNKSICLLAFSHIARDGRVLRQVEYLSQFYDLTVAGYGPPHPAWANHARVHWIRLPNRVQPKELLALLRERKVIQFWNRLGQLLARGIFPLALYLGRLLPNIYQWGYTLRWRFIPELQRALNDQYDAYHANDWDTVPLAAQAAQRHGAKLVIDLHEYAPLQFNNQANWVLYQAMISHLLRNYATKADAVTTVAPLLAEKYQAEFGFKPIVVMNAPVQISIPCTELDPNHIRLIHHGMSSPIRKPEVMIEALAQCDARYSLHLMLLPSDYLTHLHTLADQIAPGRVFFHEPVAPDQIVSRIAEFDVGFCYIPPTTYNYLYSLPNKFLESIAAGLAVVIGPSPSMEAIVRQYQLGCIAPSFTAADLAATLNQTTAEEWRTMRAAARTAANELNAQHEMQKVLNIYQKLFNSIKREAR